MTDFRGKTTDYFTNRVSRYMNIDRPGGTKTEQGSFYFCRHPDFMIGANEGAKRIFAINVITGLCALHESIKKCNPTNRTVVKTHLNGGTLHNKVVRYVYMDFFFMHFPELLFRFPILPGDKEYEVTSITLDSDQITRVKALPPRPKAAKV